MLKNKLLANVVSRGAIHGSPYFSDMFYNRIILIQWWFVYPDTFVPGRYFRINEFSELLSWPLVRTWKSVATLFVRTSEISWLSEPGLTNHHCNTFLFGCLYKINRGIIMDKAIDCHRERRNMFIYVWLLSFSPSVWVLYFSYTFVGDNESYTLHKSPKCYGMYICRVYKVICTSVKWQ